MSLNKDSGQYLYQAFHWQWQLTIDNSPLVSLLIIGSVNLYQKDTQTFPCQITKFVHYLSNDAIDAIFLIVTSVDIFYCNSKYPASCLGWEILLFLSNALKAMFENKNGIMITCNFTLCYMYIWRKKNNIISILPILFDDKNKTVTKTKTNNTGWSIFVVFKDIFNYLTIQPMSTLMVRNRCRYWCNYYWVFMHLLIRTYSFHLEFSILILKYFSMMRSLKWRSKTRLVKPARGNYFIDVNVDHSIIFMW